MAYSSVAQTLVSVVHPSIPQTIDWDKLDGGKLTHSNQRFYTKPNVEQVFGGKSARENITTEAYCDPVAHADFLQALNSGVKFEGTVIKLVSVDAAGSPIGKPDEYVGCVVAEADPRKGDLNSEDMQKIVVVWEVPSP